MIDAAEAAEAARLGACRRLEAEAQTQVLAENGMTIDEPSEALTTGLREIGAEMLASLEANTSEADSRCAGGLREPVSGRGALAALGVGSSSPGRRW